MNYSYSRISTYDKCPKKFYYKYIEKVQVDTDNPIFERGKYIHLLLEHYPNQPEFEFKFKQVKNEQNNIINIINTTCSTDKKIKYLFSNDVMLCREKQFYLDDNFKPCTEDEQRFNGVIDYVGKTEDDKMIIVDWKSGNTTKHASFDQLRLYSIWGFEKFPELNTIKLFLYFIEQNKVFYEEINRDELKVIKTEIRRKINTIENDTTYECKMHKNCEYCEYYSQCKPFNVKRKRHV